MGTGRTDEFRKDAVRIALTSGLSRRQVADDLGVGLRAFRSRPASRRQHLDMVVLAHIKEQSRLSLGSYGRPRMTEELKEVGVDVGHRRVGRLMRENGIIVERRVCLPSVWVICFSLMEPSQIPDRTRENGGF